MTLVISTLTSSGIVLSADSRQSYTNRRGAIRIGSDNAMKIFRLTRNCGVAISGKAFLNDEGKPVKDVGHFIERFKSSENIKDLPIKSIAEKLNKYLGDLYFANDLEEKKKQIREEVDKKGTNLVFAQSDNHLIPYSYTDKEGREISETAWVETIIMIIAGIDSDGIGRAYSVSIPKGITVERDTQTCGALWVGQTEVMTRVINGYAPEIENLSFVKEALTKDKDSVIKQLETVGYTVYWGTITLQDAVDFCILMTRTTESLQRFSDGTPSSPGGIPGVGGEIDIAVITPRKGFQWLRRKKIKSQDTELPLDTD